MELEEEGEMEESELEFKLALKAVERESKEEIEGSYKVDLEGEN